MDQQISKHRPNQSRSNAIMQHASGMGKLPPQAIELEESVLGTIMTFPNAIDTVIGFLSKDCFYKEAYGKIYDACTQLFASNDPIDMLTVTMKLKKNGELDACGGPYVVTQLCNISFQHNNLEYNARILYEKYLLREVIRTSAENIKEAYEDTTDTLAFVDRVQSQAMMLSDGMNKKQVSRMDTMMKEYEDTYDSLSLTEDGIIGISSGIVELDELTLGFQPGRFYLIAARPAMGKTTFALQIARNIAQKFPVAFFSMEMTATDLANKLIAHEAGVELKKIQKRSLSPGERLRVDASVGQLKNAKLFIDDSAGLNPFDLMSRTRALIKKNGVKIIFIDYLQLISPVAVSRQFSNKNDEVSFISSSLKSMSMNLKIPVIALSQLSRDLEKRANKEPMLSDLRDSGSLEQDADVVSFLYRPAYYNETVNAKGEDIKDLCKVNIAKNRHGEGKAIVLKFNGATSGFSKR